MNDSKSLVSFGAIKQREKNKPDNRKSSPGILFRLHCLSDDIWNIILKLQGRVK